MKTTSLGFSCLAAFALSPAIHAQNWQSMGKDIGARNATMQIAYGESDVLFAAYDNLMNGQISVKKYESNNWKLLGKEEFSFGPVKHISLTADARNTPYVAYTDDRMGGKMVIQKFDGNNWSPFSTAPAEGRADEICLRMDHANNLYIAFFDNNTSLLTVCKWANSKWEKVGDNNPARGSANFVSLYFNNQNIPYLAFADEENGRKASVKMLKGNTWVDAATSPASSKEAKYIGLAIDANNVPYVAYQDAFDDNKVLVKKLNGGKWDMVGEPVFTSSYNDHLAFSLIAGQTPCVAFHDSRNFDHKVDVLVWQGNKWTDLGAPSLKGGDGFVGIASGRSGKAIYVAFNDADNENRAGVFLYR